MIFPIVRIATLLFWFALPVASPIAVHADSQFLKVQLAPDLSIEIPSHWKVISAADSANLATMSESIRKDSGAPDPDYQKARLLAVNSVPSPTGATIRVNVISPDPLTQEMLLNATPAELEAVREQTYKSMKALEPQGGPTIVFMDPARIDEVGGLKAIVLSYKRNGFGADSSPWQVTQYGIPTHGKTIQITVSHRISDGSIWKPILERVKNSILIK